MIQVHFKMFLRNRFSALANPVPGSTEWWDQLKDTMSTAGEEIFGFRKSLKASWISEHTWELKVDRKNLHWKRHNCTSDNVSYYQEYTEEDREVKHSTQEKQVRKAGQAEVANECNDM